MGRKGWILLAVFVAAVAATFYVWSWRAGSAQPQAAASAVVPASGAGGTLLPDTDGAGRDHGRRVVTYKVRRGDTLGAISRRLLGSASKWRAIAKENGIRGSRIKPGMELRITVACAD